MLLLALVVLVLLWDWNWFKGPIERRVEAKTGRSFDIGGDLDVEHLGWTPTIRADGLSCRTRLMIRRAVTRWNVITDRPTT